MPELLIATILLAAGITLAATGISQFRTARRLHAAWSEYSKEATLATATRTAELVQAATEDAWLPVVYTLPGAPPTGRRVCRKGDPEGMTWQRLPDSRWRLASDPEGIVWRDHWEDGLLPEPMWSWVELLDDFGPLELMPLTEDEVASERLYGPVGARWGDPATPCPYVGCSLGIRHAGDHTDSEGRSLGITLTATLTDPTGAAVPHGYASTGEDACNCGHPEQHRPGCPRYARMTGEPFTPDYEAEPPF